MSSSTRRRVVRLLVPLYLVVIVGTPSLAAYELIARTAGLSRMIAVLIAPVVFGLTFVLVAGALSRLTARAIVAGTFPRDVGHFVYGPRRLYALCWTSLYYCGPIYHAVLVIPLLRRVVLRMFGYRGALDFTIYPDTWIRDLPLLDIASGAYLSNKATIGTNICLRTGDILVGKVSVGPRAMVGHLAMVAPGCVIEQDVEIGVGAAIGLGVHIGANTRVGPAASIDHGAVIGARCSIGSVSYIGKKATIHDDVVIPPGFTVPQGAIVRTFEDLDSMRVVHRGTMEHMTPGMLGAEPSDAGLTDADITHFRLTSSRSNTQALTGPFE